MVPGGTSAVPACNRKRWKTKHSHWPRKKTFKTRSKKRVVKCSGQQLVPNWMHKFKNKPPEDPKPAMGSTYKNAKRRLHLLGARPYKHDGYIPSSPRPIPGSVATYVAPTFSPKDGTPDKSVQNTIMCLLENPNHKFAPVPIPKESAEELIRWSVGFSDEEKRAASTLRWKRAVEKIISGGLLSQYGTLLGDELKRRMGCVTEIHRSVSAQQNESSSSNKQVAANNETVTGLVKKIKRYIFFWGKCVSYSHRCVQKIERYKYNKAKQFLGPFKSFVAVVEKHLIPLLHGCLKTVHSVPHSPVDSITIVSVISKQYVDQITGYIELEGKFSDVFFVYMRWASIWQYDLATDPSKSAPCFSRNRFQKENSRILAVAALFHQIYYHKSLTCDHFGSKFLITSVGDLNEIEIEAICDCRCYLNDCLKGAGYSFRFSSKEEIEQAGFVRHRKTVRIEQFYKVFKEIMEKNI
jgi:hypothetical protein